MTIAIYTPAPGRHHMHRKTFRQWLRYLWTGEYNAVKPYEGTTALTVVVGELVAEVVIDPLDPDWDTIHGDDMPLIIGDLVDAQYHAEHGRRIDLNWQPPWMDFTGSYRLISVHADDEQKALPVGSGS